MILFTQNGSIFATEDRPGFASLLLRLIGASGDEPMTTYPSCRVTTRHFG